MIKWIVNLSANEMWTYGIVATVFVGIFLAVINHIFTTTREGHKNIISASPFLDLPSILKYWMVC